MTTFKWLASLAFATTLVSALNAETSCPGNVASLPFLLVNHHQMIVAVSVNHSGPFNFLLDTGMQITLIDPSLAAELHFEPRGAAMVAGAGSRQSASYVPVDLLEAGSHAVPNQNVLVYELQNLYGVDLHVRGILGEDFLEHFDMLVDNVHSLLCLDETAAMRNSVKGPHLPLASADPEQDSKLAGLPIISVRLSDATRSVRLLLDSGTNGAILYNTPEYLNPPRRGYLPGAGVDGKQRMFPALPPQDVKIGSVRLTGVPFVSLGRNQKDARAKGFDGVLTFGLFRRVFIAHADHFAVLEPK
jgi:Aspartyl protease